jgi:hypothetical protein
MRAAAPRAGTAFDERKASTASSMRASSEAGTPIVRRRLLLGASGAKRLTDEPAWRIRLLSKV